MLIYRRRPLPRWDWAKNRSIESSWKETSHDWVSGWLRGVRENFTEKISPKVGHIHYHLPRVSMRLTADLSDCARRLWSRGSSRSRWPQRLASSENERVKEHWEAECSLDSVMRRSLLMPPHSLNNPEKKQLYKGVVLHTGSFYRDIKTHE